MRLRETLTLRIMVHTYFWTFPQLHRAFLEEIFLQSTDQPYVHLSPPPTDTQLPCIPTENISRQIECINRGLESAVYLLRLALSKAYVVRADIIYGLETPRLQTRKISWKTAKHWNHEPPNLHSDFWINPRTE